MDDDEKQHLLDLLRIYRRKLRLLQRQVAIYGPRTSPDVLIELEEVEAQITHILAQLETSHVPRVQLLGEITAGQPLPDPEDTTTKSVETVEVLSDIVPAHKLQGVYALRVRGHSMIDALIDDGDIVLIRYQETAENGQMAAVYIEDENSVTLKRFYRDDDTSWMLKQFHKKNYKKGRKKGCWVRLQPANPTMEPIYVDAAKVRIQGIVVGVLRNMIR
jgi:repressor LexA